MQLVRFRHKGLRLLHEDGNAKGVPSEMADKLRKLVFALETAASLEQFGRFPGWKLHRLSRNSARPDRGEATSLTASAAVALLPKPCIRGVPRSAR